MTIKNWVEDPFFRRVLPYSTVYTNIFNEVRSGLLSRIEGIEIEHIGSTAVPGLAAKPMIDLLVVVQKRNLAEIKKALVEVGFCERDVWVDTPEKPYVGGSIKWDGQIYDLNVHICRTNSPTHTRNIRFRDALRSNADLRSQYERLKIEAMSKAGKNPQAYNEYKAEFIRNVMDGHL